MTAAERAYRLALRAYASGAAVLALASLISALAFAPGTELDRPPV